MNIVFFYHSVVSDWNHGNAHFLRGIATECLSRGHDVKIFEPAGGWSLENLKLQYGDRPVAEFRRRFPHLRSTFYTMASIDLAGILSATDLVLVHEWNAPELVKRIGDFHKQQPSFLLFFHDTHHRAYTLSHVMGRYDLSGYDGVLAYGEVIRRIYMENGWAANAWTWHEAADTRIFHPMPNEHLPPLGDLVWIGNWGDEERTGEYREFLMEPVRALGLRASAFGVQYPEEAVAELADAGIGYHGWVANFEVPRLFSRFRVTVHIPRRPYAKALPGIPTIRPFEALACGIPLICAPWEDAEHLFTPGKDYLVARNGREMREKIAQVLDDPEMARRLADHGRRTIETRHTCAHRVDELMAICRDLGMTVPEEPEEAGSVGI